MSHGLLAVFGLLVGIAIPLASFAAGLRTTEPLWLFRRPRLLGRSLVAVVLLQALLPFAAGYFDDAAQMGFEVDRLRWVRR